MSYLLEQAIIDKVKKAGSFERTGILSKYFLSVLADYEGSLHPVNIVSKISEQCFQKNQFTASIENLASYYEISSKKLQRYFEMCAGA